MNTLYIMILFIIWAIGSLKVFYDSEYEYNGIHPAIAWTLMAIIAALWPIYTPYIMALKLWRDR